MIWKQALLGLIGFAGGISVAGGVFAFISILEMLPRLASKLHMANRVYHLENCIFWGGLTGAVLTVFEISVPFGSIWTIYRNLCGMSGNGTGGDLKGDPGAGAEGEACHRTSLCDTCVGVGKGSGVFLSVIFPDAALVYEMRNIVIKNIGVHKTGQNGGTYESE